MSDRMLLGQRRHLKLRETVLKPGNGRGTDTVSFANGGIAMSEGKLREAVLQPRSGRSTDTVRPA